MGDRYPVEVMTRYSTNVESLADAWAFVMERVDAVGPDPRIEISPTWLFSATEDGNTRRFSVVVDGMVPEPVSDCDTTSTNEAAGETPTSATPDR